jgi:hypothetical protein
MAIEKMEKSSMESTTYQDQHTMNPRWDLEIFAQMAHGYWFLLDIDFSREFFPDHKLTTSYYIRKDVE